MAYVQISNMLRAAPRNQFLVFAKTTTFCRLIKYLFVFFLCTALPVVQHANGLENVKFKASVEETLSPPFVVDEKNLRKLNAIVIQRITEQSKNVAFKYVVSLSNNSFYETQDFENVVQDENINTRKIESIEIIAFAAPDKVGNIFDFQRESTALDKLYKILDIEISQISLRLSSGGIHYFIKGSNRDWVFNSQIDIIERLDNMRKNYYGMPIILTGVFGCVGFLLLLIPISLRLRRRYDADMRSKNTSHGKTPLSEYMFNVKDPNIDLNTTLFIVQVTVLAAVGFGAVTFYFSKYLFPDSIFALGDQIPIYEDLLNLRQALLWGGGVAIVTGTLSSIIGALLLRRGK